MQSLWVGPYLRDVAGFDAPHAARLVSVLGFAMMAGCVGFGAAARVLERRGVSVYAFCGVGMALFVATQAAIVARVPLPPAVLWAAYGMFGGVGILTYAVMAGHFPAHLIGRANTTLTLVIFLLIFAFQIGSARCCRTGRRSTAATRPPRTSPLGACCSRCSSRARSGTSARARAGQAH